jgi:hypothetical protein
LKEVLADLPGIPDFCPESYKKRPVSEYFKYCPDGRLPQTSDSTWFALHSFRQYSKVLSIDEYNISF